MERLIEALSRPEAYPFHVEAVTCLRTHISVLFFAGDRVYKVKRPVHFPFVDYSTRERRRHFCELEVTLNAALAPGIHLGVVPIIRGPSGLLCVGGPGVASEHAAEHAAEHTVEYAVEMRRLPADRMLDQLLARGEIDNDLLRRIVSVLLPFHATAPTGGDIDAQGSPGALTRVLDENLRAVEPFAPSRLLALLRREIGGFPMRERERLDTRVREGRIRDGHGDLHAGNICVTEAGIFIYDRIEFNPAFRQGDVAAEIAFLAMDLDARGFRAFADYFCRAYGEATGDAGLFGVLPFYKSHRALIRSLVAHLRSNDLATAERNEAEDQARDYLHLAVGYHLPPALVCVGGLPGTGKSTVARRLATALRATLIRSDVVRKALLGIPLHQRWSGGYEEGPYTPEMSRRTYDRVLEEARAHLKAGRPVVVDATLGREQERERFRALAAEGGTPFRLLLLTAPEETIRVRMAARQGDASEVSDAGMEVYRRAQETFEMPEDALLADGCEPASQNVSHLLESLA